MQATITPVRRAPIRTLDLSQYKDHTEGPWDCSYDHTFGHAIRSMSATTLGILGHPIPVIVALAPSKPDRHLITDSVKILDECKRLQEENNRMRQKIEALEEALSGRA